MTDRKAQQDLSRRRLLTGTATGLAVASIPAGVMAAPFDPTTPAQRLHTYMRLRGALDDRLVVGFLRGRYHGVVDDEITPLYGVAAATFARFRRRPDGGYDGATYEAPFFTELDTGEPLEHWRNPYTGEVVDVPHDLHQPARVVVTPDLRIEVPRAPPGLVMSDKVVSMSETGGDVWLTEETTTAFTVRGMGKPFRYSEIVTLHARETDLRAPADRPVRCETAYASVVSWRPWQKMGNRPGHLLGTGAGRYNAGLTTLPDAWRAAARRFRPELLTHPELPLADVWRD